MRFGLVTTRGLGVFTHLPTELITIELPRIVVPIQVGGASPFLLIAVWAMPDKGDLLRLGRESLPCFAVAESNSFEESHAIIRP
jgi:hypothetical protein